MGRTAAPALPGTHEFGPLFEHFFINEVRALSEYHKFNLSLSYYRTERGAEVDLIIETPAGAVIAVEIKSAENPIIRHAGGLNSFRQLVPSAHCLLACRADRPRSLSDTDITVLPWLQALVRIAELSVT